jgi:hypothetical protein
MNFDIGILSVARPAYLKWRHLTGAVTCVQRAAPVFVHTISLCSSSSGPHMWSSSVRELLTSVENDLGIFLTCDGFQRKLDSYTTV